MNSWARPVLTIALTLSALLPGRLLAQDGAAPEPPDLSGAWNHPASSTDGDRAPVSWAMIVDTSPPRLVVEQTATELRVTGRRGFDTGESTFVYRLDGSESANESMHFRSHQDRHVSTARWVGATLLITTVTTHEDDGTETESISAYSLDFGGPGLEFTRFESSDRFPTRTSVTTTRYLRDEVAE